MLGAIAHDLQLDLVALEFAFKDFGHFGPLAVEVDLSVRVDLETIDRENDVAGLDFPGRGTAVENAADEHTGVGFFHAKRGALRRVEHGKIGRGEIHVAVVGPVLDILEEPSDDGCGNHVTDILRNGAAESLEGHANHFAVLHDGTTTVARVDRGVDLDGQMAVDLGVAVGLEVDAGNHAGGDGKTVATDGVAVGAHR